MHNCNSEVMLCHMTLWVLVTVTLTVMGSSLYITKVPLDQLLTIH
jgi:hypothetical protein